jgi:hypothetical protein
MSSSEQYKKEIMNDLAGGNTESLDRGSEADFSTNYENFDDFAQRSSTEERRSLFGRSFHPDRVPASDMEPELQKAIAQIEPQERDDVAREFFKHFKQRGLSERQIQDQLNLSTHHASRISSEDVSKLATFAYHTHPDIFRDVLADRPTIIKFLSNPIVGATLGAIAAKWMKGRH